MSVLLKGLLVLGVSSVLLVACGEKEATPVEAAPAPVVAPAVPAAEAAPAAPAGGGGYEPTAEERVPGITLDAAAVEAAATTAAEAAPVEAAPAAN